MTIVCGLDMEEFETYKAYAAHNKEFHPQATVFFTIKNATEKASVPRMMTVRIKREASKKK